MAVANQSYCGRFAPSPSGPLHAGSLIAALASYLDARHHGGQWLLRIDDIDPPREQAGAAQQILQSLSNHGLHWDGQVMYQSQRSSAYEEALQQLKQKGLLFHCDCTRQILGPGGSCNGRCLPRQATIDPPYARRITLPQQTGLALTDRLQGSLNCDNEHDSDVTVVRKDGLYAYLLAVVVDDAAQGITHVVRGADLWETTARQVQLQALLNLATPAYCHVPVLLGADGHKLSKQNHAPALDDSKALENLRTALSHLDQEIPTDPTMDVTALLQFAAWHWNPERIQRSRAIGS